MVAAAIVEHIRLCNWRVERGPPWGGFAELGCWPKLTKSPAETGPRWIVGGTPHKGAEGISESLASG